MEFNIYMAPSIFKNAEPLQISCLKSISKSLDRVILCGSQPVDIVLQKCVHVLQCFYSSKLIEITSEAGLLEDSYLEFLINKYLKEIDFKYLSACSPDAIIQRFAEVGFVFQNVSIGHYRFAADEYQPNEREFVNKIVCHLANVTTLKIDGHCTNETLRIIADNSPKLEELRIENCCISSRGLYSLCTEKDNVFEAKCNNLRILSLSGRVNDNAILFLLKHIPTLESLDYNDLPKLLYDSFHKILNSEHIKFNLTELKINMAVFDDISVKNLHSIPSMCPRLKTLFAQIETQAHVEALYHFVGIENLTISYECSYASYQRDNMNYNILFNTLGSGLKELRVFSGAFSVSVVIRNCTNLECLGLTNPLFQLMTDDQNTALMNKLVALRLADHMHRDDAWWQSVSKILESCPNLKRLYLINYDFSKSAILLTFLKKSCTNFVSLEQCDDVPMDLLEDIIRTTPSLQTLRVVDCGIDEKSIKSLGEISKSMENFVDICWDKDLPESYQ